MRPGLGGGGRFLTTKTTKVALRCDRVLSQQGKLSVTRPCCCPGLLGWGLAQALLSRLGCL